MNISSCLRGTGCLLLVASTLPACGAKAYVSGGGAGGSGDTTNGGTTASGTGAGGATAGTGGVTGATGGATAGSGGAGGQSAACASDIQGKPFAPGGGPGYTLLPAIRISVPQDFYSEVGIGDVTGDGRADIVGSELDHNTVFRQTDAGALSSPAQIPHAWYNPGSMALLEADGDGILDVAMIGGDGMEIFRSLGEGMFMTLSFPTFYGSDLHVMDLDFDGDDDLVWYSGYGLTYSYGDGSGAFTEPVQILDNPQKMSGWLRLRDMTGDMIPDVIVPDSYMSANLVIVPHDGVSAPSSTGWSLVPFAGAQVSGYDLGDVNGDGLTDAVWQDINNIEYDVRTHLMLGQPGGGFAAPADICKNGWGGPVSIGDVNGDGRDDVVAVHDHSLSVILSTPAGMAPPMDYDYPSPASTATALAIGDVNCDGCSDVVAADVGGLVVFYGQGCSPP